VNALQDPELTLDKKTSTANYNDPSDSISYTYEVTNTGNVTIDGPITVADNKATVSCPALTTVGDGDNQLDVGEKVICSATYNITQADIDAGSVTNKATAKGSFNNTDVFSNEDTVTVNALQDPELDVTKEVSANGTDFVDANTSAAALIVASGSSVTYRFTVENTGNVTLTNVALSDDKYTFGGTECTAFPKASMAPGDKVSCSITRTITADIENTATATGKPPVGSNVSDTDKAFVNARFDLVVTKDGAGTFTRTYEWSIDKSADKSTILGQGGTNTTVNYTVKVDQTGVTDSNWQVTGKITVSNPNPDAAIAGVDITDSISNGGSCSVTNGTNVSVPASSSIERSYTCTYGSKPSYTATNTATATWSKATYSTPNGSDDGTAPITFGVGTRANQNITVTDTFNGGSPTTLFTLTAEDTTPYASRTQTYPRSLAIPWDVCRDYANTARITETGQTDSWTVNVCGSKRTGARTIGFWQNKNGQDIIAKYSGTNCQALRTWLNGFNPFKDLAAVNCTGVKSYVTSVIKSATASGSSMNAMLKAQMLATALDVYFSDPALGGNRLGAPAPIGGVTVDLTRICKMNSGAISTCTGSFTNVSSAFGGASSLTVRQMLSYAASQSNVGGSAWYGNVKATQEKAKDAFDAINNEWVFSP
jgi:hypothetical protein